MVVEHAERFGLSALHQLRGRVGRGNAQSYAFLIYAENLTDEGKQRIRTMLWENDGFKIAEEDLKIRGPGNMAGKEQSGFMRFKIANLGSDLETMMQARKDAFDLLESDPELRRQENRHLKTVIGYREKESLAV
jgi:ATP-dependent DNA helicase RecG